MSDLSALIGTSTVIRHVQHLVVKVAEADAPVLITGEPGTGKEFVARSIHEKSGRSSGPFIVVKCAQFTEENLETELFGHVGMSASPARDAQFLKAKGGTLFLEEVAKLSPRLQSTLVKIIQEGSVEINGLSVALNVRIICSTSANIDHAVRERQFREDLYYRLAGCAVYIPPLRERREDIPPLVEHFIHKYNQTKGKSILGASPDAMSALLQHSWTHNIRELENLMERIVVLKNSGAIEVCDLPPRLRNLVTDNIDSFYDRTQPAQRTQTADVTTSAPQRPTSANMPPLPPHVSSAGSSSPRQSSFSSQQLNNHNHNQNLPNTGRTNHHQPSSYQQSYHSNANNYQPSSVLTPHNSSFDETSEIEQFIKKEIDLGGGIDFYRVVEEFENRLIAEALRRTNHNKNRAAQLLSMNRTTLVEKLKKRAASSSVKVDSGRVKRNPAFTIFDGLGRDNRDMDTLEFHTPKNDAFTEYE